MEQSTADQPGSALESVEAYGLVSIIPGRSIKLTKKGRDFVHENGLDVEDKPPR